MNNIGKLNTSLVCVCTQRFLLETISGEQFHISGVEGENLMKAKAHVILKLTLDSHHQQSVEWRQSIWKGIAMKACKMRGRRN